MNVLTTLPEASTAVGVQHQFRFHGNASPKVPPRIPPGRQGGLPVLLGPPPASLTRRCLVDTPAAQRGQWVAPMLTHQECGSNPPGMLASGRGGQISPWHPIWRCWTLCRTAASQIRVKCFPSLRTMTLGLSLPGQWHQHRHPPSPTKFHGERHRRRESDPKRDPRDTTMGFQVMSVVTSSPKSEHLAGHPEMTRSECVCENGL